MTVTDQIDRYSRAEIIVLALDLAVSGRTMRNSDMDILIVAVEGAQVIYQHLLGLVADAVE